EYHEHRAPVTYNAMKTGMGSRSQPMLVIATTAGINISYPCYAKRKQVEQILEGTIYNDDLWGMIYSIDDGDDWADFNVWKKANPNYGVSVYDKYLKAQYTDAIQNVNQQNINICKHLNKWMNAGTAWMNLDRLSKCVDPTLKISDFEGVPCMAAIDLASKIDILSRVLLFPFNDMIYCFGRHYLPADTINQKENQHYQRWRDEGYIVEMDGAIADYQMVEQDLLSDNDKYPIQLLGYDPSEATYLIQNIAGWLGEDRCVEINQGPNQMSEPMKELEADIYSGKFVYNGDPVLTWMFSNTIIKQAKGGGPVKKYYPTKDRPDAKIDGVVALIMARKMTMSGPAEEEILQGFIAL
ncbi:MAG TPA: terminase TerL endonuclease subunit, partial [Desulfobacterales bacterium]|nr:terminase TerL endonuclease subunit [Desulfobacterales bacterium]